MARSIRRPQGRKCKHVLDIPYSIRLEIYMAMDASGSWRSLARELNKTLEWFSIAEQGRGDYKSPSTALLREWEQLNPTIEEFFRILHKLGLYREMQRVKSVVSSELHYLANPNSSGTGDTMRTKDLPGPIDTDDVTSAMPPGVSTRFQQQPSSREYEQMTEPHTVAKVTPSVNMVKESVKGTTKEMHKETHSTASNNAFRTTGLNEFCYEDIRTATSEFSDKLKLGAGGFSKVFYCEMDGTGFAVKVFSPRYTSMDKEELVKFHWNEIEKLTKHRHPNIINLCGYSNNGPEFCLVLEYMAKGSLEKCLTAKRDDQQRNHLSWYMRYKILKDAASGVQYLHSRNCTHGDIKSANILLDANFVAKLADFDLAEQVATSQNMAPNATGNTRATQQDVHGNEKTFGTLAYLPADVVSDGAHHSRFTDIYSFGVVICEVLTGLKAYSKTEERKKQFLKDRVKALLKERCRGGQGQGRDLVGLCDRNTEGWPGDLWARLMDLALHCLKDQDKSRPDSEQLHERLTDLFKDAAKLNDMANEPKTFKLQCYHKMLQKMQQENQRQQNQQQGIDRTSQNVSSGSISPKLQYLGGVHSSLPEMNNSGDEMLREDFSLLNIKISSGNPTEGAVATNVGVHYDKALPNNLQPHSPMLLQVSRTDSSQLSNFHFGTSSQYPTTIQACACIGSPIVFATPNVWVSSRESSTNSSTNPSTNPSMNPFAASNRCVRDDLSIPSKPSTPSTPYDSNSGGQFMPSLCNNMPLSTQYSPIIPESAANIGVNLSEPNLKSTQNPASQVINQFGTTQSAGLASANLQFDEVEDFRQKVDNLLIDFNLTDDLDSV